MATQVELSTVLSVGAGVLSLAFSMYLAIVRYAIGQKEAEIERRLNELGRQREKLEDRLAAEVRELAEHLEKAREKIIPRTEWELRMTNVEGTLRQILGELRVPPRHLPPGPGGSTPPPPSKKA